MNADNNSKQKTLFGGFFICHKKGAWDRYPAPFIQYPMKNH